MVPINFRVTKEMRMRIKQAANRGFESQQSFVVRALAREIEKSERQLMKFRVVNNHVYEDVGDTRKGRLVMVATPTGALMVGPGLGDESEALYGAVTDELAEKALDYWRNR